MNKSMLLVFMLGASSVVQAESVVIDLSSGYEKIHQAMHDEKSGIAALQASSSVKAPTANIKSDLNIPAIAASFSCKTKMGQDFLEEMLALPISPADTTGTVQGRQKNIQALVTQPALKAKVEKLLAQAALAEETVAKFLSNDFVAAYCPEVSEIRLLKQVSTFSALRKEFFQSYTIPSVALDALSAAPFINIAYGLSRLTPTDRLHLKIVYKTLFKTLWTGIVWRPEFKWDKATDKYIPTGQMIEHKDAVMPKRDLYIARTVTGALIAASAGFLSWQAYKLYKTYSTALQKRNGLHGFNRLVAVAQAFEKLAAQENLFVQFPVSKISNPVAKACVHEFKKSRYAGKNTKVIFHSKVHTFTYDFYEQDKEQQLGELFVSVAELDAYNAIADAILKQTEKNPWCFATFVRQSKPMVAATEFWNVLIKNAVTNDITEDRNIVLTGPNAGGKSTAIRAMLQNIVFAQTFGVAAAKTFACTPFDYIHSYINVSDDLIGGLSLFASEVKRAQEILAHIATMKQGEKYFFALDELFTGTNAVEGEACATQYISQLAAYSHIQFVYATHFEKLKELGESLQNCVNYKVDAPEQLENGTFKYPFTISQGASNVNIALQMANNAGLFVKTH